MMKRVTASLHDLTAGADDNNAILNEIIQNMIEMDQSHQRLNAIDEGMYYVEGQVPAEIRQQFEAERAVGQQLMTQRDELMRRLMAAVAARTAQADIPHPQSPPPPPPPPGAAPAAA